MPEETAEVGPGAAVNLMTGAARTELVGVLARLHRRAGVPSQRDLGEHLGVSHTQVGNILAGRSISRLQVVSALADALGATREEVDRVEDLWRAARAERHGARWSSGVRVEFVLTERQAHALLRAALSAGHGVRRSVDLVEAERRLMEAVRSASGATGR